MKMFLGTLLVAFVPTLASTQSPNGPNENSRDLNVYTNIRWKDRVQDVVQIPYNVDSRYYSAIQKEFIEQSIQVLADVSKVIKFVQRTNQASYISVVDKTGGCGSRVGKSPVGREQEVNLAPGCLTIGVIQHEFLHALGFSHEQNRPDRDDYVEVKWDNIIRKNWHNFYKASSSSILGARYEYRSIMHYGRRDFAIDRSKDTVTPLDPDAIIGQRQGATVQDFVEIRLLYQCLTGPRSGVEYLEDTCTSDCKCWEGAEGCNGNDDACQGNLVCAENVCVQGEGTGAEGTGGGGCTDVPGWSDSQGDSCEFYEQFDRGDACAQFGSDFGDAVTGKTASEACCFCGGGSIAGITFLELKNVEYPEYCLDVAAASTTNGAKAVLYPCNGTPAQRWWVDSNNYFRSALDTNKCVVGSGGDASQGTNLILNDCLANDDRFVFLYYTDATLRPKNNANQCIGPSSTEGLVLNSIVTPLIHMWDCSSSDRQKWFAFQPTTERKLTEEAASSIKQCQDIPLGWYDAQGYNCAWYGEIDRCDSYGSTKVDFGKTANQACCACGGGSLLKFIQDDEVSPEGPIPNENGCWDNPIDWTDSVGDRCNWYAQGENCVYYGNQFGGDFGTANEACCACGGGSSEPPPAQDFIPEVPGCSDSPSGWLDVDGDGCDWYNAGDSHCDDYGGNYTGTQNKTANEACCACGGGYNPNGAEAQNATVSVSKSSWQGFGWLPAGLQLAP